MKQRCQVCNKEFEPKNYWQKYCSGTCKQAAWAIKKFQNKDYSNIIKFKYGEDITNKLNNYVSTKNDIYEVKITFYHKTVNRLYKKTKKAIEARNLIYCDTKPDLDNEIKPILDSLTGKIWKDDMRIVKLTAEKFFSNEEETEIEVRILS